MNLINGAIGQIGGCFIQTQNTSVVEAPSFDCTTPGVTQEFQDFIEFIEEFWQTVHVTIQTIQTRLMLSIDNRLFNSCIERSPISTILVIWTQEW